MYSYYKQVSRRRHQYGDPEAMAFIPLSPLDHMGSFPAYEAGIDAIASDSEASLDELSQEFRAQNGSKAKTRQHQLPPLATNSADAPGAAKGRNNLCSRGSAGRDGETKGDGDLADAQGMGDPHHVGVRCPFPL